MFGFCTHDPRMAAATPPSQPVFEAGKGWKGVQVMSKMGMLLASFTFSSEKGCTPQEFITTSPWSILLGDHRSWKIASKKLAYVFLTRFLGLYLSFFYLKTVLIPPAIFSFPIVHFCFYCSFSIDSTLVLCSSSTNLSNDTDEFI